MNIRRLLVITLSDQRVVEKPNVGSSYAGSSLEAGVINQTDEKQHTLKGSVVLLAFPIIILILCFAAVIFLLLLLLL